MDRDAELIAVEDIVERLTVRFPAIPRPEIVQTVHAAHQDFDESPIREFVPLLVEHAAKSRLSGHDGR